jgi:hypothetical protein
MASSGPRQSGANLCGRPWLEARSPLTSRGALPPPRRTCGVSPGAAGPGDSGEHVPPAGSAMLSGVGKYGSSGSTSTAPSAVGRARVTCARTTSTAWRRRARDGHSRPPRELSERRWFSLRGPKGNGAERLR